MKKITLKIFLFFIVSLVTININGQTLGGGSGGLGPVGPGGGGDDDGGDSGSPQTPIFESIFKEASVIPPSPNATAFNKFIDIPVGHYTGVPNVSVPIYTISMPQLSLPISLNYHAGGLKVGERSSWVGAGWSLNAGGSINRTVRGLPDDYVGPGHPGPSNSSIPGQGRQRYGFLRVPQEHFYSDKSGINISGVDPCYQPSGLGNFPESPTGPANDVDYFAQGYWDTEPDLYHFSFPGGSGKFVFNRNREIVKFVVDDNEFTGTPFNGLPDNQLTNWNVDGRSFVVRDASGITYTFSATEITRSTSLCGEVADEKGDENIFHVSNWLLTRMERGGNVINFEYVDETISYDIIYNETKKYVIAGSSEGSPISSFCRNSSVVNGKRLSRITTSTGYSVVFSPGPPRQDLNGSKSLSAIDVRKDGKRILYQDLNQSYFGTNRKLRLDGVDQRSNTTITNKLPGYQFTYIGSNSVPKIDSKQQDYWGYFNGASQNDGPNGMVPSWKDDNFHVNQTTTTSREPDENSAKIGTMSRITYPTGGYTDFYYELNDYYAQNSKETRKYSVTTPSTTGIRTQNFTVTQNSSFTYIYSNIPDGLDKFAELRQCINGVCRRILLPKTLGNRHRITPGDYQLFAQTRTGATSGSVTLTVEFEEYKDISKKLGGGLRVKRTKFFDPVDSKSIQKIYQYTNGNQSSGVLFTVPHIGHSVSTYTPGTTSGSGQCTTEPAKVATSITIGTSPSIPLETYQGSSIGYSKVQEINYDSPINPIGLLNEASMRNGMTEYTFINDVPASIFAEPYVPAENLSHKNGKPRKQTVFKYVPTKVNGSHLVKLQESTYEYNPTTTPESVKAQGLIIRRSKSSFCYSCGSDLSANHIWRYYNMTPKWHTLDKQITAQFDENGANPVKIYQQYTYDASAGHYFHTELESQDSEGDIFYSDYQRNGLAPSLITKRETFKWFNGNSTQVAGEIVNYKGGLPENYYIWNRDITTSTGTIPGVNGYEHAKAYDYDNQSRLIEDVNRPNSVNRNKVAYLWGYKGAYVVAQITNITQAELNTKLSAISASRGGISDNTSTTTLRNVLLQLKGQVTAQDQLMTIYLYDDRYGLSETHDPNGRITKYEYDSYGRLIRIKDHDNYVLTENEYNYSNQ